MACDMRMTLAMTCPVIWTKRLTAILLLSLLASAAPSAHSQDPIRVASKTFSESHVLGEIVAQLLEARGYPVKRQLGLGGTLVTYEAIKAGELDVYPEYSGTLIRAVMQRTTMTPEELQDALAADGARFDTQLGFNNSYAIAVSEPVAERYGLEKVSDLRSYPALRFSFSHEFLNREDGWPALRDLYALEQQVSGIEHSLAYRAIDSGQLDVTDAYTTDGELDLYRLRLLEDDLGLFPEYQAGLLTRHKLDPEVRSTLNELSAAIDESTMRALNRRVATDGESPYDVAAAFLREAGFIASDAPVGEQKSRILHNTLVHLKLTAIALILACAVAIPLAISASRFPRLAGVLQYVAGLIQTVPALALLALMIPLLGLGQFTAITALFLYSLLPIVRNTLAGLAGVDPLLKEVAMGMGLTPRQRLRKVELPLAMPMILAGIRTATVISIGTATLAAFVGAGGLGEPILTGLSLNDNALILQGALPAAGLAIVAEFLFQRLERLLVPAHLVAR
ncbi:MAG: glycine betaine ABC transporter substrate-binding protein [Congregibacter sp.]